MPIPNRPTFPTDRADLLALVTDDGSRTFLKTGSNDTFHSGCGAISETRHVYLKNSEIAEKIANKSAINVLEIGLGTAMGMLLTVDHAIIHDAPLTYLALETEWVSATTLQYLNPVHWGLSPTLVDSFLAFRRSLPDSVPPGIYQWDCDRSRRTIVHVSDVRDWANPATMTFDAIYYDPFCPESAPELWSVECFRKMRSAIADDGRLTTYSCSRRVRNAMEQAGWKVQRVPGPSGGKREVIVARPSDLGFYPPGRRGERERGEVKP